MFRKLFAALLLSALLVGGGCPANTVTVTNPGVWPLMKRARYNPAVKVTIRTDESKGIQKFEKLEVLLDDPDQVARITLRTGDDKANFKDSAVLGSAEPKDGKSVSIKPTGRLERGENVLWLDVEPSEESVIGSEVIIKGVRAIIGGKQVKAEMEPVSQRIGIMLAFPGEEVAQLKGAARPCAAFRIPGLIRTKKGTLIGCFDARYDNEIDLCRDIDVAAVRSLDGGQTWTLPKVNMDSGPGMANGCGDPCILQDKKGRIWMQALACHFGPGSRAINSSGTGTDPSRTGQWEMVYSDNEGKSWSKIVNVTRQVKKDEWTLILAGPGNGICTKDGTIVFPAQIWQNGADPVCRSTICYSRDGRKWKMAPPVPGKTSECQVVELADGSLMLNCRHEARSGRRAVYVTDDLGETWTEHETHCKALSEPVCQASLIAVETKKYGRVLLFSNPRQHGRSNMTVRASLDEGKTWNQGLLYDVRGCMGYSCLAMTDPDHVGVIYETCHTNGENGYRGIGFIRLPLKTIVTGEAAEVKAARLKVPDEDEAGEATPKKSGKGKKSGKRKKKSKKKK